MAQNTYPVLTGAPFLRISPDARAGGLGDQGVATSADAFSQFWNASKFPFSRNTSSAAVSYTPWMGKLTNDVFLLYLGFNTMLGEEDRSSLSASIYYFNMGEVDLRSIETPELSSGTIKPNEFSIDLAYALKLSDTYILLPYFFQYCSTSRTYVSVYWILTYFSIIFPTSLAFLSICFFNVYRYSFDFRIICLF